MKQQFHAVHLVAPLALILSLACSLESTTEPEAAVQNAPVPIPPAPSTLAGLKDIAGTYELEARITDFDPVWGVDLTGYRYTSVLTFQQDSTSTAVLIGRFERFQAIQPDGEVWSGQLSGYIAGQRSGFELVGNYFHWTAFIKSIAAPVGDELASPFFEGSFFTGGHISGTFSARRIRSQS